MEYLDVSKIVTAIVVAVTTSVVRYIYSLLYNYERIKIKSNAVELIDKVINERKWKKKVNRVIIEEAFEQIYMKPLSFYEILILINSGTPSFAFKTYLRYRHLIEMNGNKTKFKFKKGKLPYWVACGIRFPKALTKGFSLYFIYALFALHLSGWILQQSETYAMATIDIYALWFLDILLWVMAIIYLVEGFKNQSSEAEIIKYLGDKFESTN